MYNFILSRHDQTLYGTYRPHNRHNKYEYNNFASSFEDEFDLKQFRKSDPINTDITYGSTRKNTYYGATGTRNDTYGTNGTSNGIGTTDTYHHQSRSTSEANRVQSQNLPSSSTYGATGTRTDTYGTNGTCNGIGTSAAISESMNTYPTNLTSTYPSIQVSKYQDEYTADYSVNMPPISHPPVISGDYRETAYISDISDGERLRVSDLSDGERHRSNGRGVFSSDNHTGKKHTCKPT